MNVIKNERSFNDAIGETFESILEVSCKQGLINDIPVFGTFYKLANFTASVSDALFLRKLSVFLNDINKLTKEDLSKVQNMFRHASNSDIAEKIILIINSLTEPNKSSYIAKFTSLYSQSELTRDDFLRSVDLIQKLYLGDLEKYRDIRWINHTNDDLERRGLISLIGTPLIRAQNVDQRQLISDGRESELGLITYEDTDFGRVFKDGLNEREPYSEMEKTNLQKQGLLKNYS